MWRNLRVSCSVRHLTPRVTNQKDEMTCLALTYADMIGTAYRMNGYTGLHLSGQPLIIGGYTSSDEMRAAVIHVGLHDIRRNALTMLRKNEEEDVTFIWGETRYHVNDIIHKETKPDIEEAIVENYAPDGPNYPLVASLYMGELKKSRVALDAYDYMPFRHEGVVNPREGLHAVLIVGVDNTYEDPRLNHCLVKNSWGPEWGKDGFTKIALSVFEDVDIPVFSDPISGDVMTT